MTLNPSTDTDSPASLGDPEGSAAAQGIPVVDLFAGPGGLGEGFAAGGGPTAYDLRLSIEKDVPAHRTLELRSFFRQFPEGHAPSLYYDYVRGDKSVTRAELWQQYPEEAAAAERIAWRAELGRTPLPDVLERIREAIGSARHWVLLGGPPCQAYSVIGRARMRGSIEFADDRRHTLYREYLKIVAAYQPTVFVMENVKGILSSKHKRSHIFQRILEDMRAPWEALSNQDRENIPAPLVKHHYQIFSFTKPATWDLQLEPIDYLIESERYGVPQARHRVILLGVRSDYFVNVPVLKERPGKVTVRDVLEGMPALRSVLSLGSAKKTLDSDAWARAIHEGLESAIQEMGSERLRRLILAAASRVKWYLGNGGKFIEGAHVPAALADWLHDSRIGGVLQHESRAHMGSDLQRYLFGACFAAFHGASPRLRDFPTPLLPKHENLQREGGVEQFPDRFKVQVWNQPSSTITSHIAKDGHYYIHPDPGQVRSLSVREAARLQTFPDNYFFEGNRTEAYQQIGNAVPPYLAWLLAGVVGRVIKQCEEQDALSALTDQKGAVAGAVSDD